jgi:hypothetical protein
MSALSQADRELIADMRTVLLMYMPTDVSRVAMRTSVLQRSAARLAESGKPAEPTKRHRWHWFKWLLLRGDQ